MIFVLGIERSGTTWVSNIIDMHPYTELYMEPLSGYTSRFRDWPSRFIRFNSFEEKSQYFLKEFAHLKERKRLFFCRFTDSDLGWTIDMKVARKLWSFSSRARDFFELNFNRYGTKGYPDKCKDPIPGIKELRLNFNSKVIKEIDPSAKVIVILRNYASNIKSIEQHISLGNLSELENLLKKRFGSSNIDNIFRYWSESYNALLNDLDTAQIDYFLVKQEELITNPIESVDKLFQFMGFSAVQSVYEYLNRSNKTGKGKHSTKRNHATILQKNRQNEKELYPLVKDQIESVEWHPSLKTFVVRP